MCMWKDFSTAQIGRLVGDWKQDRKCSYSVTLRRVRVTIFTLEKR